MSESSSRNDLQAAVQRLYEAFSAPYETSGEDKLLAELAKTKAASLAFAEISQLIERETLPEAALRYLLPKAAELTAFGPDRPPVVALSQSMQRADAANWPEPDRQALSHYLHALWAYRAETGDGDLLDIATAFGWLLRDLQPLFDVFEQGKPGPLCRSLARVLKWQADEVSHPHPLAQSLGGAQQKQLVEWLDKVGVRVVEEGFFESFDEACADVLAEAVTSWKAKRHF